MACAGRWSLARRTAQHAAPRESRFRSNLFSNLFSPFSPFSPLFFPRRFFRPATKHDQPVHQLAEEIEHCMCRLGARHTPAGPSPQSSPCRTGPQRQWCLAKSRTLLLYSAGILSPFRLKRLGEVRGGCSGTTVPVMASGACVDENNGLRAVRKVPRPDVCACRKTCEEPPDSRSKSNSARSGRRNRVIHGRSWVFFAGGVRHRGRGSVEALAALANGLVRRAVGPLLGWACLVAGVELERVAGPVGEADALAGDCPARLDGQHLVRHLEPEVVCPDPAWVQRCKHGDTSQLTAPLPFLPSISLPLTPPLSKCTVQDATHVASVSWLPRTNAASADAPQHVSVELAWMLFAL